MSWIRWLALSAGLWSLASDARSDPINDRIIHTGARAIGQVSVFKTGAVYSLRFVGDETIEYQINLGDPAVAHGVLRVYEKSSDSYPIYVGGPGFRFSIGGEGTPDYLANWSTLTAESSTPNSVVLDYVDNIDGVHHRRHEFTIEGKSLRIRVRDLDSNLSYNLNYCGLLVGRMEGVDSPKYVPIMGALATPLITFKNGAQTFFAADMLDMYVSNASDWGIYQEPAPGAGATSVAFNVHTFNTYKPASNGLLSKSLDDTLNLTVSRFIKDVLVTPTQPPSPYRALLTGRTVMNLGGVSWPQYLGLWNLHQLWGMDQIAGYVWDTWTTSAVDGSGGYSYSLGPDWYPAKDASNFTTMVQQGLNAGMILGAYMAFNTLPPTAPPAVYDLTQCARNPNGTSKLDVFTGFPLLAATASAIHAARESGLVKSHYGINMAYIDIQTYGPPATAPDGDHIDQVTPSPWAHTLGQAIADQKTWFSDMQNTFEGPLLGEGSIATAPSNFEWLWAGYCDSIQRVINTGGGNRAQFYPIGDPNAPTNWPVIPEFEQRVMSRVQANHGNGFPDRFFGKSDGPSRVSMTDGSTILPMTEAAFDRYRLYEITYGKTSYLQSNGPFNGIGNYLYFADMIKEYYMMTALQDRYYDGVPRIIKYLHLGVWKTFEDVLSQTGTTNAFRDAQIRIRFSNGLEIFLNHNTASLVVTVDGVTYTIPEDGFLASNPDEGFIAFSAITPATGGQRIDYCYAPLQYEFFDGRGVVNGYGGINTRGLKRLWLKNFVHNRTVWELNANEIRAVQNGPEPTVMRINVEPMRPSLITGERTSLKATATYSNGSIRNVTTLVDWSSSNVNIARVNNGAACTAVSPGQVTISVTTLQGAPVVPATIQVN